MPPTPRRLVTGAIAASLVFVCRPASSQPASDVPAADELFNRGKELVQAGQWAEGCAKFRASMALDPGVGTLLKIAKCDEHEGKLAGALHDYHAALSLNRQKKDASEQRRAEVERYATEALERLEPRVPRLRLLVAHAPAGLQVSRGGELLPLAALGERLPADPGPLEIVSTAPGYQTWHREVRLEEGGEIDLEIAMQPITPARDAGMAPLPAPARLPAGRVFALGLGATGVAALGIAGWLGLQTLSKVAGSSTYCDPARRCRQPGVDLLQSATEYQAAGLAALGVGVVLLGSAATLWVTQSAGSPSSLQATLQPAGLLVRGSW